MHTEPAPAASPHWICASWRPLSLLTLATLSLLADVSSAQPLRPIALGSATVDRETLRTQILVEERQTQRERLVEARMRLAERLQTRDATGIEEARRAVTRIEEALESLGRELERQPARLTVRPVPVVAPGAPGAAPATPRPPAAFVPPAPAPWWDVYGAEARPRAAATSAPASDPAQP